MRDSMGRWIRWCLATHAPNRAWTVVLALLLVLAGACGGPVSDDIVFPNNWPLPKLTLPEHSKRAPLVERTGPDRYVIKGVVIRPGQIRFGVGFKCGDGWSKVSSEMHDKLVNLGFAQRRGPGRIHYYSSSDRTMDVRLIASDKLNNHYTILVDLYDKPQVWMIQS